MRILFVIRMVMVAPVDGNPQCRRELQRARPKQDESAFKPKRTRKASVRDEPVEADVDADSAEQEDPDAKKNDPRPAKEPRNECKQGERVTEHKSDQSVGLTIKYPHGAPPDDQSRLVVWRRVLIRLHVG